MPGRIRVLLAINTLDRGGSERQLVTLATGLDRSRFDLSVVCVLRDGPLAEELKAAGIEVSVCDVRTPIGLGRLVALVTRADIVQGFLFGSNVAIAFAARAGGHPRVITSRRSLSFFKDGRPHYDLLQSLANRNTAVIVANADAVREDTIRRERVDPAKVRVIYNGIDAERLSASAGDPAATRAALSVPLVGPLVVVIANLIPYKGLDHFIEAWREVADGIPDATAVVVGEGPARADLELRAEALGGRIHFVGSRSDVPAILAAADLVAQSSLYEGFPNAVLEAMAIGRPVVATAVGGTAEAVVDGRTGLLVPPRDSHALAQAMLGLLRAPSLGKRYGTAGRERVEAEFSIARMIGSYEGLYGRLAERRL